jgi:hypothetical protein
LSPDTWDAVQAKGEFDEAVGVLRQLPPRLREVAFLRATGYQYDQIAEVTGDSRTTVSRLVRRAQERIHDTIAADQRAQRPSHGRAGRLEELERELPTWLTEAIGRPPGRRAPSSGAVLLQWRRAALLIDDYRRAHGIRDRETAIGERPVDPERARSYTLVATAIQRVHEARHPCRGLSHEC